MRLTCLGHPLMFVALFLGCASQGGFRDDVDQGAPAPDLAVVRASCGNGILDRNEVCDSAIAINQPGACPTSCSAPTDHCQLASLSGSGCQTHCTVTTITSSIPGDGCCPAGATRATDSDCHPFLAVGSERDVCGAGKFHVPVVAAGGDRFAVGCLVHGGFTNTPVLRILDSAGGMVRQHSLMEMDGQYYNEIQTSFFDGRFQALYQYNCDDDGSWASGEGWGCIDFREYATDGSAVTPSLVFGQRGHNGHPILAWNGSGFGVGWISYDTLFARLLDKDRKLLGGDRLSNILVQQDPKKNDDRNGARTRIHWNGSGYGMFTLIGVQLYFTRLNRDGAQLVTLQPLGAAFADIPDANLSTFYDGTVYHVSYFKPDSNTLVLLRVDESGKAFGSTKIQSGEYFYPSLISIADRLYLFSHDADKQGFVTVLGLDGKILDSGSLGQKMIYPQAAYDAVKGNIAVVYQDTGGSLKFQALRRGP